MSNCLIYGLIDPTTNMLRYVGQTSKGLNRPRAHLEPGKYNRYKSYNYNWIKSLMSKNIVPEIVIIEECEQSQLNDLESFYITYFKAIGCPLTNQKPGGKQCRGYSQTLEARQNMSKERIGRFKGKENPMYGKPKTEAQIKATVLATSKPIKDQYNNIYSSMSEASRKTGFSISGISKVVKGERNSIYGYIFSEVGYC